MNIADIGIIVTITTVLGGALIAVVNWQMTALSRNVNKEIRTFAERIGNHEARIRFLETQATENAVKLDNLIDLVKECNTLLRGKVDKPD
ncbi:MAG: hypothetical protein Q8Q12_00460 [bacterium]|nr:hypothetical protein [bacterium]